MKLDPLDLVSGVVAGIDGPNVPGLPVGARFGDARKRATCRQGSAAMWRSRQCPALDMAFGSKERAAACRSAPPGRRGQGGSRCRPGAGKKIRPSASHDAGDAIGRQRHLLEIPEGSHALLPCCAFGRFREPSFGVGLLGFDPGASLFRVDGFHPAVRVGDFRAVIGVNVVRALGFRVRLGKGCWH
jgi:hypothetical protein